MLFNIEKLFGACAVLEFAETMAFIGLQIDLVLYLILKLNFAHTEAATTVTNFAGTAFLCPLLGGFIADTFLGRFWTILVFGIIELVVSSCMHLTPLFAMLISRFKCDTNLLQISSLLVAHNIFTSLELGVLDLALACMIKRPWLDSCKLRFKHSVYFCIHTSVPISSY